MRERKKKKLLKQFNSDERVFNIEKGIETLQTEIKNNEKISKFIIRECRSESKNGKTIIFILTSGMIELHEILSKNVIYMHLTVRVKKEFEKIKKEIDNIKEF